MIDHASSIHLAALEERGDEQRHAGRLSPYWIRCDAGHVLDISATGMRLLSKKARSGTFKCLLTDDRRSLKVRAQVVWSKRIRFRQHEVGVRFLNLTPEETKQLSIIASSLHE